VDILRQKLSPIGIDAGRNQGTLSNRNKCREEPRNSIRDRWR